jgi:hypothetical protein
MARFQPFGKFSTNCWLKNYLLWHYGSVGVTGLNFFFFSSYILGEKHGLERDASDCCTYTSTMSVSEFFPSVNRKRKRHSRSLSLSDLSAYKYVAISHHYASHSLQVIMQKSYYSLLFCSKKLLLYYSTRVHRRSWFSLSKATS